MKIIDNISILSGDDLHEEVMSAESLERAVELIAMFTASEVKKVEK